MNPRAAHLADFANPAHDLDFVVIPRRAEVFDVVASLKNHPIAAAQLLQRMPRCTYGVIVSLFDPVEKDRVMSAGQRIELIAFHTTLRTISVTVLHDPRFVTANAESCLLTGRRQSDFNFRRHTQWPPFVRVDIYPERPSARPAQAIGGAGAPLSGTCR